MVTTRLLRNHLENECVPPWRDGEKKNGWIWTNEDNGGDDYDQDDGDKDDQDENDDDGSDDEEDGDKRAAY